MRRGDARTAVGGTEEAAAAAAAPAPAGPGGGGGSPFRLYAVHPLMLGPLPEWEPTLRHAAALGFSAILVAPPFAPGRSGNLFHVADHDRPHPVLAAAGGAEAQDADALLASLSAAARAHGLELHLDLVLDRVAADGRLAGERPGWFGGAAGWPALPDPRHPPAEHGVLRPQLTDPEVAAGYLAWWQERLRRWVAAGVAGFRCDAPDRLPAGFWRGLIAAAPPPARFIAWTPGVAAHALAGLGGLGFAATCDSLAWWDFRAGWFAEEAVRLAAVAPALSVPEAPFGPRLAAAHDDPATAERAARRQLRAAMALGTGAGWVVPMGLEYGGRSRK